MENNTQEKKFDSNKEGIKIVKVAAFCFAIVSWIATAEGLQEYVFYEQRLQAIMVSFSIQAILFVFNLKLPQHFRKIGDVNSHEKREYRKYYFGKRKGNNKNSYKWTFFQKLIAIFYVMILVASSFFSFVYMTNLVYKNTEYIDSNIVLTKTYRICLNTTEEYVEELTKITQLIISEKLSELQEMISRNLEGDSVKSKDELELEAKSAKKKYEEAQIDESMAQHICDVARETYETPMTIHWRDEEVYNAEWIAYKEAERELQSVKIKTNSCAQEYEMAQSEVDNYRPNIKEITQDMLTEILKTSPDIKVLNSLSDGLNEMVVKVDENGQVIEEFADTVTKTQELAIAIKNYSELCTIQLGSNDSTKISCLEVLKDEILKDEIIIPEYMSNEYNEQIENWELIWKERFLSLEKIIESIPDYSKDSVSGIDGINQVVNIELLNSYEKENYLEEMDKVARSNLFHINPLERACGLLNGEFPFLARFSFFMALFLDVASLLAGLFIYLITFSGKQKKNQNVLISDIGEME